MIVVYVGRCPQCQAMVSLTTRKRIDTEVDVQRTIRRMTQEQLVVQRLELTAIPRLQAHAPGCGYRRPYLHSA